MTDIKEEVTEEIVIDMGSIQQKSANAPEDWSGGGGGGGGGGVAPEKPPAAIPKPYEDDEETEPTEESETLPETTEAPAATNSVETDLHICCDYDGDAETPVEDAPDVIPVEAVEEGGTYKLEAVGTGNDAVQWKTSNKEIATVDELGLVTFTGEEGEVTIELWKNDGSATIADSVIFHTVAETAATEATEAPAKEGGAIGGIWPYILIALLSLVIVVLMVQRSAEQKRRAKKAAARKRARREEEEHTIVQATPIAAPTVVPAEDAVAAIQPMTGIRAGVYQAIGARKDQQDSYGMTDPALYAQQGVLALVADGMGGLANGKAVSSALVNTFLGEYRGLVDRETPQDTLVKLSISANQRINQMLVGADRSGSTLVSVVLRDGLLHFLTVGDSRIYLYRGGALLQLNREHIYQEELAVKAVNCQVPLSQVAGDRQAHALTSFFGSGSITYMDRNYEGIRLVPGDRVLLCSDGVFGTLTQAQMERAMEGDVKTAAENLKEMVLEAGKAHQDNNTCLILEYLG